MKKIHCEKCGKELNKKNNYCTDCRVELSDNLKPSNKLKKMNIIGGTIIFLGILAIFGSNSNRDVLSGFLLALFGASLLPYIYKIILNKIKIEKINIIVSILIFSAFVMSVPTDNNFVNSEKINDIKNYSNLKIITDEVLKDNFIDACSSINMNIDEVKNLKKVEDWNSGPRYTFNYSGNAFILYAHDNGNISSITIDNHNLYSIYLEGYEPYNVRDYLLSSSIIANLQITAESSIKSKLNNPDTADFHWFTSGGYSKNNNIYIVTGKFEAKNSFGVKSESRFYIEEIIENGNYRVVYMTIDGKKYIGSKSQIKNIERKEIKLPEDTNTSTKSIILKEGQKGEFGKEDLFDGEKYIRYYLPAGKYEIEAVTKNAQFFVETIALHKENGWDTATTIRKVKLTNLGDKDIIEITSSQCISLVTYTQIKLTKVN